MALSNKDFRELVAKGVDRKKGGNAPPVEDEATRAKREQEEEERRIARATKRKQRAEAYRRYILSHALIWHVSVMFQSMSCWLRVVRVLLFYDPLHSQQHNPS